MLPTAPTFQIFSKSQKTSKVTLKKVPFPFYKLSPLALGGGDLKKSQKATVDEMIGTKVTVGGVNDNAPLPSISTTATSNDLSSKSIVQAILELATKTAQGAKINEQHLAKMIARASSPDFADFEYVQDLLLTYPCFCSPAEMFTGIIERFNNCGMESFATPLDAESLAKRQQKEHMRYFYVIIRHL